jgi:hypothetical protein
MRKRCFAWQVQILGISPAPSPPRWPAGALPRLLSFVKTPQEKRHLPCTTHVGPATMYEEPCIAFVKLSINTINLGLAGAAGLRHGGWFGQGRAWWVGAGASA